MNDELLNSLKNSEVALGQAVPTGKLVLFGRLGVGKTVFAFRLAHAICPPGKRIAYVDSAEGWVSLLNHPQLMERTVKFQYKGFSQLEALANAIREDAGGYGDIGVIILDEYSSMSDRVLDAVVVHRDKINTKGKREGEVVEFSDRYIHTRKVARNIAVLYTLPGVSIIVVAHERSSEDDGITVDFPAAVRTAVGKDAHVVCRLYIDNEGKRRITSHPVGRVEAKSRIAGMGTADIAEVFIERVKTWLDSGGHTQENTVTQFEGIEVP